MWLYMLVRKAGRVPYRRSAPMNQQTARQEMVRSVSIMVVPVLILAIFLLLSLVLTSAASKYSYSLMEEKRQVQQLQRENEDLRVEISTLETPDRIYTLATQQLGMVAPSRILYGPAKAPGK